MKKIKELWQNNKIMIVLMVILIACFIAICVVAATYFFGGSSSPYGDRLSDIDQHVITEDMENTYKDYFKDLENVEEVAFNDQGKIIYIHITYTSGTSLQDGQNLATSSLEVLDTKLTDYYDVNFVISAPSSEGSEGFTMIGAKNVVSSVISWSNNTPVVEEGE